MALTPQSRTSQSLLRTITQYPAEFSRLSQVELRTPAKGSPDSRISQAVVRNVVRGRVFDPKVRAWTYTLDGHDFYVLRLGNETTLVYDNSTGQWATWGSFDSELWKAYDGFNWIGGRSLGQTYGSDVVVTDDGNGALYFLAPLELYDDDAVEGDAVPRPFTRKVTGQVILKSGYDYAPCFGIQVYGSVGNDTGDVTLTISDNRGESFRSVGTRSLVAGQYDARLVWMSLGSMRSPGRLLTVTDDGALQNIANIEMEIPDGAA